MHNDTTLLLGLSDVVVDRVKLDPDGIRIVHVMTRDTAAACPSCGALHVGEGVGHDPAA